MDTAQRTPEQLVAGLVKLLEVNPNPGWCWDGKMNLMAQFGAMRYADMLRLILEAAQERIAARRSPSPRASPVRAEPAGLVVA